MLFPREKQYVQKMICRIFTAMIYNYYCMLSLFVSVSLDYHFQTLLIRVGEIRRQASLR